MEYGTSKLFARRKFDGDPGFLTVEDTQVSSLHKYQTKKFVANSEELYKFITEFIARCEANDLDASVEVVWTDTGKRALKDRDRHSGRGVSK